MPAPHEPRQNRLLAALPTDERKRLFPFMTQELIANMLDGRREGVTEAAGSLQGAGVIRYSRGHIAVLDRPRSEARVCKCSAVVKKEFDRLIPEVQEG